MTGHPLGLLATWILHVIATLGYGGVLLLMAMESACIPLPSEVILPFAGYLVWTGRFNLFAVAIVGALGCNLGSAVAYEVGARGGRGWLERYGRWLLLRPEDLDRVDRWFASYGEATVFFCRLLPVFRTFIALPAGVARMRPVRFHLYTFLGSLPWCWALAYVGFRLGQNWAQFEGMFRRFDLAIVAVIAAGVVWFAWRHWPKRANAGPRLSSPKEKAFGNEK